MEIHPAGGRGVSESIVFFTQEKEEWRIKISLVRMDDTLMALSVDWGKIQTYSGNLKRCRRPKVISEACDRKGHDRKQ